MGRQSDRYTLYPRHIIHATEYKAERDWYDTGDSAKRLRRLIAAKPIVRILESHSGLTGLIIENIHVEVNGIKREFDGMWSSSLTDSTSKGNRISRLSI